MLRCQRAACLRAIVAEGSQGIIGVTGPHTQLVCQAIVSREELLSDVCAVSQLPIVARSKQEQPCITPRHSASIL